MKRCKHEIYPHEDRNQTEPKSEIVRFEHREYKRGRFGFVFVKVFGKWIRSAKTWEEVTRGARREV